MDHKKIEKAVQLFLEGIGEDCTREGLAETPKRIANMCEPVSYTHLGREDATNVVSHVLASVITPIGLDHMAWLGDTIAEIAGEKAGIIKEKGKVISFQTCLLYTSRCV